MRPFLTSLRPPAPTAFDTAHPKSSVWEYTPRLIALLAVTTVGRVPCASIVWLRSRRQCRTPCPLRLHIVTAFAQP